MPQYFKKYALEISFLTRFSRTLASLGVACALGTGISFATTVSPFQINLNPGDSYTVSNAFALTHYQCTSTTGEAPQPDEPGYPDRGPTRASLRLDRDRAIQTETTILLPFATEATVFLPNGNSIRIVCGGDGGGDFPG